MELSVLNIAGQETGRKIVLDDAIFGIQPNEHAIYLDVKQFLANNRQVVLRTLSSEEEVVFLVPYREITASN